MSDTDCILFIDDEMARFIIAWKRSDNKDESDIARIIGIGKGQVKLLIKKATAVGIIVDGEITKTAQMCIDALIKNHVNTIKG